MALPHFAVTAVVYFISVTLLSIQIVLIRRKPKENWYKDLRISESMLKKQNWRFLYEKAQEMLIHYDNLNWQIGSILVGSSLVSMGLSLQKGADSTLTLVLALAGMISSFAWIFWFTRHMALYNLRNDVLYMIEEKLGFQHHSLSMENDVKSGRWLGFISGHWIAIVLAIGLSTAWMLITLII